MSRSLDAILWWYVRANCRVLLALGRLLYGLEVQGREHLPSKGPLILVIRVSGRVGLFLGAFFLPILKKPRGFVGGPAILNMMPLAARLSRKLGLLPVFKGKSLSAIPLMQLYNELRQGKIVVVAAEGELTWDGRLQPWRPGAAWLALRTHAPLIMVTALGDYDIWPRWASRPHLTGKMIFKIGKPFFVSEAPCERVTKGILETANQRLLDELGRLTADSTLAPDA